MKKDIHPDSKETKIECACGKAHNVKSTKGNLEVEICSNCHPFFTGQEKIVDKMGRVEKFKKKMEKAQKEKEEKKKREERKKEKSEEEDAKEEKEEDEDSDKDKKKEKERKKEGN